VDVTELAHLGLALGLALPPPRAHRTTTNPPGASSPQSPFGTRGFTANPRGSGDTCRYHPRATASPCLEGAPTRSAGRPSHDPSACRCSPPCGPRQPATSAADLHAGDRRVPRVLRHRPGRAGHEPALRRGSRRGREGERPAERGRPSPRGRGPCMSGSTVRRRVDAGGAGAQQRKVVRARRLSSTTRKVASRAAASKAGARKGRSRSSR
jgi:hypothetical protein